MWSKTQPHAWESLPIAKEGANQESLQHDSACIQCASYLDCSKKKKKHPEIWTCIWNPLHFDWWHILKTIFKSNKHYMVCVWAADFQQMMSSWTLKLQCYCLYFTLSEFLCLRWTHNRIFHFWLLVLKISLESVSLLFS